MVEKRLKTFNAQLLILINDEKSEYYIDGLLKQYLIAK